jgi:hypothetical protein
VTVPAEGDWAYRSAGLRGLSYRFSVRCDDAVLGDRVAAMLAGLRAPPTAAPVDHRYGLITTAGRAGTIDVLRDGEPLARDQRPGDALSWVVWDVNRAAAESSGHHLLFHAGALEAGGNGLLLPGSSGSGKSTLTAGLARRGLGLGYLSDELVALDLRRSLLLPYAKPITVKAGSFAVLPDLHPDRMPVPGARTSAGPWTGAEWQVPVGGHSGIVVGRACPPRLVVLPRYERGARTRLVPLSDTDAFLSLALHSVNLPAHGAAGSVALGRLVAQSDCYALTVSDLDEACALVRGLVEGEQPPAVPRGGAGRAA